MLLEAEVTLCTAGICLDGIDRPYDRVPAIEIGRILSRRTGLGLKRRTTRCVCDIAEVKTGAACGNFVQDFGERNVADIKAPSAVEFVAHTCFQSDVALVLRSYARAVSARRLPACFADTAGAHLDTACPISNVVLPDSSVASSRKRSVYLAVFNALICDEPEQLIGSMKD
jgi:hypothetical protein